MYTSRKRIPRAADFARLPTPLWWKLWHPFNGTPYANYCLAHYVVRRMPERAANLRSLSFQVHYYHLWQLWHVVGKKILLVLLVGAFVVLPFVLGYLAGLARHITITIH